MRVLKTITTIYKKELLIAISFVFSLFILIVFPGHVIMGLFILLPICLLGTIVYFSISFFKHLYILSNLGLTPNQALSNGLTTPELYLDYIKQYDCYYVFGRKCYLNVSEHVFELIVDTLYNLSKMTEETEKNKKTYVLYSDCYNAVKRLGIYYNPLDEPD